ncbi:MAG: formate dehydrogenase accessory protein FdhE [Desulfovibrionaceae bacterium]
MTQQIRSQSVEASLEQLRRNRPAYAELVDTFQPLLCARERLAAAFSEKCPAPPAANSAARRQGAHLLAGQDLLPWSDLLDASADTLLPILGQILNIPDLEQNFRAHLRGRGGSLAELARDRLAGDENALLRVSESMSMGAAPLSFILENIMAPVLSAISAQIKPLANWSEWAQPNCPVCGSLPSFAFLSLREPVHTEQLVSGGGKKHLHCSLCGHDWRVRRDTCTACGSSETEQREIIHAEGVPGERIEACGYCGSYCLCVDLRQYDAVPAPETVPLGLVHLDILAQGKKLRPLAWTVWNSLK